ncbi:MAG: NapC/NirT family cytochrome c [Anaerolineales bacterium]
MRKLYRRLVGFFFPPPGTPLWQRVLPYATLGLLTLMALVGGVYAWDYTNSPEFCGTTCHTMPPEFNAYLVSPHARVQCVECHIGRGFFATRFTRKAGDIRHIISLAFHGYEFPITANQLRPARETCERCHFPEKFSDDSLVEIQRYANDEENTPKSIYLTLKTGGGSSREGLGKGIHWHIENDVLYLPTDEREQEIPYVMVVNDDGSATEYISVDSDILPGQVNAGDLKRMDCITCHNRITHLVYPPEDSLDLLLARGLVSPAIPEIRAKGVEALRAAANDESDEAALGRIEGLGNYYQVAYPDFYAANQDLVDEAIDQLKQTYQDSVFREQKTDWNSHPNNVGHKESPGCFRCHDGKHLNYQQEAIRLECNLCHSIPVVAGPNDIVANIEISRGVEPESHLNANWISLHHEVFNESCSSCHTTGDPGGVSNTTFCSNSACHGSAWEYAGFDAPELRDALADQFPPTPTPVPLPVPADGPLTYANGVGDLLAARCGSCHNENGVKGLDLTTYSGMMAGSENGPVIVPGDPEASLLVLKQSADEPHFAQLTDDELALISSWIGAGAPEN